MAQSDVYSTPHRIVHWITAALIIGLVPVGMFMASIPYPPNPGANPALKDSLYEWHKSFGLIVLLLAIARVALKVTQGTPPPEASLTRFQRAASAAVHHLLYLLIFLVPFTGWLPTSMCYGPVNLFWTIDVTLPFRGAEATCSAIYKVHLGGALLMSALVLVHVGAALMHLVVIKDGVFRRMWG
ncbi:cytochrome b [Phreatobacter sp.]|uniref:cytochrome b n=1 Tax=Phreatobacter sp. TaxID=1966341 RepID=UPI0022C5EC24|nr:cytochrome b [Phreatobacter sp.]MCZ8316362.1 cytochrome b [Phreatobacter sp.]